MNKTISEQQKKITIVVMIILGFILFLIIRAVFYNNYEDFAGYEKIVITEAALKDSVKYEEIRNKLENDIFFSKVTMVSDYNYKNFEKKDLRNMIKNFVIAYSIKNDDNFDIIDNSMGTKCLKKYKIINAFEELYNVNISDYLEFILQYNNMVTKLDNLYCIHFEDINEGFDNEIKVGIDSITANDDIITIKMYIYDYYTDYLDYELINIATLEKYIDEKQFVKAAEHVDDLMNGNVTKKEIKFMINDNPEYFIYKILEIHEI